ncbi:hypothetical protein ASG94_20715 [Nocardioides sp. Soil805]|nr:hypothetical protein ASG94_20715 [Nocardioides sp. Soil805]
MVTTDVHLNRTVRAEPTAEPIEEPIAAGPGEADLTRSMALVSARLRERFDSVPATTVEGVISEVRREFDGSRVRAFVPILVERLARDRLTVLSMPAPQADQA